MEDDFRKMVHNSYEEVANATGTVFDLYHRVLGACLELKKSSRNANTYSPLVDRSLTVSRQAQSAYHEFKMIKKLSEELEIEANLLKHALKKSGSYNGKYN